MSSHENCPCMAECPLNRALKLIGGKWKMQILCSLHSNGPTRYNQLKRTLDGVSNTVLPGPFGSWRPTVWWSGGSTWRSPCGWSMTSRSGAGP
jgi:hypothetical protein